MKKNEFLYFGEGDEGLKKVFLLYKKNLQSYLLNLTNQHKIKHFGVWDKTLRHSGRKTEMLKKNNSVFFEKNEFLPKYLLFLPEVVNLSTSWLLRQKVKVLKHSEILAHHRNYIISPLLIT